MKKRLVALGFAAAVVLAIPVAASAAEGEEALPEPPPIDLEERFETFDEAVAAVTERMTNALERLTERYVAAQERDDAPEALLEHLATAIDRVEEHLVAVADADDFADLNSILEEGRAQRREARADRPHRLHRCGQALAEQPPVEGTS